MIYITSEKGENYSFDPSTSRIFKDGYLMSSIEAEPIYSNSEEDVAPRFSGILIKGTGTILSLSGKYNQISDPNTIL